MPELAEPCLASWRKFLPDYELKLWNEDSFDVNRLRFTRQAYERRKFAFVTDYVRLYALKSFGGIYMDTDVEVLRSLDDLLGLPGFTDSNPTVCCRRDCSPPGKGRLGSIC